MRTVPPAVRTALVAAALALGVAALPPVSAAGAPDGELEELMYVLKRNLKGAATALADPARESAALEHLSEMQRAAHAAKLSTPESLDELEGEERARLAREYRVEMATLLRELAQMEIDLLEGRREKALANVSDVLFPLRERAHEKFRVDD